MDIDRLAGCWRGVSQEAELEKLCRPRAHRRYSNALKRHIEVAPQEMLHPDLCEKYRPRLEALPEVLPHDALVGIVRSMCGISYQLALTELETSVTSKDVILHQDKRDRVQSLLIKANQVRHTAVGKLFTQELPGGYRTRMTRADRTLDELTRDFAMVDNCWVCTDNIMCTSERTARDLANILRRVDWHRKDIAAGGCVLLFGEEQRLKGYEPMVQTRAYITPTKKGDMLFIDTIEGGDMRWCFAQDWNDADSGAELLYAIASAVYIAREIGLVGVVAGEREAQEIAADFGFREQTLFDEDQTSYHKLRRKIGIPASEDYDGPYVYKLQDSVKKPVFMAADFAPVSEEDLVLRTQSIADMMSCYGKVRKNLAKVRDISTYLDSIAELNKRTYDSERVRERIMYVRQLVA